MDFYKLNVFEVALLYLSLKISKIEGLKIYRMPELIKEKILYLCL